MIKDLYRLSFEKKRNNELRISAQELTSKLVALLFYKRQILDDSRVFLDLNITSRKYNRETKCTTVLIDIL